MSESDLDQEYEELQNDYDPETGVKTVFVRDKRQAGRVRHYILPDYYTDSDSYELHKKNNNLISGIMAIVALLTLLGAMVAAWVAITERVAKSESIEAIHSTQIGKIIEQVDTNSRGLLQHHYDTSKRFDKIIHEDKEIKRQLGELNTMMRQHWSKSHENKN